MKIALKRVYEEPDKNDGYRILVDRLWPRGIKKEAAAIDDWFKNIAPSDQLRQWFGHEPEKWPEFKKRYFQELKGQPETVNQLTEIVKSRKVTLIFGAKDTAHNNAMALKEYLEKKLSH
ncbi:protein of unknown function DUF488 [Nitrosococcus halophilus Nc 4]|uniref:Uroporphyrin-III C-methyltransferase n=1 Tax=Nitrosococcus halophilus (strain Nc4) TaxID=472759 RepID=D5BXJ6_NITHN|nr:DUF488 domain-containing protein [Nitrosococcus halophilus]ADE13954.1 protein of unknown function DUF488 [Nitrosococcus halophilus Nc 4]